MNVKTYYKLAIIYILLMMVASFTIPSQFSPGIIMGVAMVGFSCGRMSNHYSWNDKFFQEEINRRSKHRWGRPKDEGGNS